MNRAYVTVDRNTAEVINKAMNWETGDSMDSRFGEDDQFACTADFGGGVEMDIKCCGVQYEEGGFNNAWAEAVLFDNGCEVAVSDIDDDFFGEWELEYNGTTYVTEVVCA